MTSLEKSRMVSHSGNVLEEDLDDVVARCIPVWKDLAGGRLFFTGGTGFIGKWLLGSLRRANEKLGLGITATVLTRDPSTFAHRHPELGTYASFQLVQGDVRSLNLPAKGFTHVIHGATDASAHLNESDPLKMFDTVLDGTRKVLQFCASGSPRRILFMSSGAVYGQQPWDMEKVSESWMGGPNCCDVRNTYAEAKRAAEMLCAIYAKQFQLGVVDARIFALLGPHLSLDIHFAAGNFIRDAINGRPIIVNGNGMPCRSYLYASDLCVWLWNLLAFGRIGQPYNIGSEESVSIKDLARRVATLIGRGGYKILGAEDGGWNLGRYVPDTSLIRKELGMVQSVWLDDAIMRTAIWNGWRKQS